jgi:hypothetical protein
MTHIFRPEANVYAAINDTAEDGYAFLTNAINHEARVALEEEILNLPLEAGDHVNYPINQGTGREVRQLHERVYHPLGHPNVPKATRICQLLADTIRPMDSKLSTWLPTEIGYQRYRNSHDWISPHRDRLSDRLLSVTITITGSALVKMYKSSDDYRNLECITEFQTSPGTIMFLRAPGFASGSQIIHEVYPPTDGKREIVNFRMRSTVLKPPSETKWR